MLLFYAKLGGKEMNTEKVVGKFVVNGTDYVVVKMENATHVMPEMDWKKCYGGLHHERWNKK